MQTLMKSTRAYRLLKAEADKRRFSHAYLLLMDDSRNLRTALKAFAKVLFGCDEAVDGRKKTVADRIDAETYTDCLFFPENGKKFVVDDAERVTEESVLQPVEGDIKVFVIADFAEANAASQNKLLKMLEEPPQGVIFLLGATTAFPVLQTVLSRVAKLEIPPFQTEEVTNFLRRTYADKPYTNTDFELCGAASGGSVGAAQNMLEDGDYKALVDDAFSLCLASKNTLPTLVRKIGETKHKKELLFLLRVIFRDATIEKSLSVKGRILLQSEKIRLQQVANTYRLPTLLYAQKQISEAEQQVTFNAYFPQCIEILIAKILQKNTENTRLFSDVS